MNEQQQTRVAGAGLDPEVLERATSRREALFGLSRAGLGVALGSAPLALTAMAKSAFGQTLPAEIASILNFALTLEELEADFYVRGLNAQGLIPQADRAVFTTIRDHELRHVQFLREQLGSQAVARPTFDFTGGNGSSGGPFSPFTSYAHFLLLAQGFEDLGVRAYKGQLAGLMSSTMLISTLAIHSVEARHAAQVRRLRGEKAGQREQAPYKGWITLRQVDAAAAPIQPIYNAGAPAATFPAEDNTTQGGVNLAGLDGITALVASEAFDEPLDRDTVLAIAGPFIAG